MEKVLYYKEKTSKKLNEVLLTTSFFQSNFKLIPLVAKTLNQINCWNEKENGKSSITHSFFEDRFENKYTQTIFALESVGLLKVSRVSVKKTSNNSGKCYSYECLPLCHSILADHNKEYLYKVMNDPIEKRKIQKSVSKRQYNHKIYGDIRDTLKETIDEITFDCQEVEKICDTFSPAKQAATYHMLLSIVKRDYKDLVNNDKDNRIWTPYAQLPKEIKEVIQINGFDLQQVIDIRSCYPTLFAEYISTLETSPQIEFERKAYNDIFLCDTDPKDTLSEKLNIPRSEIKAVFIEFFNGKHFRKNKFYLKKSENAFVKFNAWLSTTFPNLYRVWLKSEIKQTGNNIGKYFETKLMLDASIYRQAELLDIIIGYEYDGMSFYAADRSNCEELLEFIKQRSIELLGIQLVFTDKTKANSELNTPFEQSNSELNTPFEKVPETKTVKHFIVTDDMLFELYSVQITGEYNKPISYIHLSKDVQSIVREHVSTHRDDLEDDYLRLRSEMLQGKIGVWD